MSYDYRPAEAADIPALAKLATDTLVAKFGHLYSEENLNHHLEKSCSERYFSDVLGKDSLLLVWDADRLIAYAKWGENTLPVEQPVTPCLMIDRLYVDEAYQGQKIGHQLMLKMFEAMQGQAAIYLSVFSDNEGAQRFYQRYGFSKVGEYDYMVGTHADHEFIYGLVKDNKGRVSNG